MMFRLVLQTQRDRVDDARRVLDNARNLLQPDLNLTGALSIPTDPDKRRAGVDFEPGFADFEVGLRLGLPIDRYAEEVRVRQSQIEVERAIRNFNQLRDDVAVVVRGDVRGIDRARFSLEIQERNIGIGEQRVASINAAPDRANARDASEAANDLAEARDARDSARRDLQVAVLRYLLNSGQLRVTPQGLIIPLSGMPEGNPAQSDELDMDAIEGAQAAPPQP
jgi:outer membrane protein TolC